jgi:photosystem II stability/assembly factor-like uncharacterized protein
VGRKRDSIKTTDSGNSWTPLKRFTNNYLRCVYFIDTQKGFVAGAGGQIFKTENGGKDWKKIETEIISGIIGIKFTDDKHGFAVSGKGEFLYSADSGETWNLNRTGRYVNLTDMSVSPTNDVFFQV